MRLFGPFCRDFLVPWEDISVVRKDRLYMKLVQLSFGWPAIGKLTLSAAVADRLALVAGSRWPETEPVPEETSNMGIPCSPAGCVGQGCRLNGHDRSQKAV